MILLYLLGNLYCLLCVVLICVLLFEIFGDKILWVLLNLVICVVIVEYIDIEGDDLFNVMGKVFEDVGFEICGVNIMLCLVLLYGSCWDGVL